jgi:hypothetical protein
MTPPANSNYKEQIHDLGDSIMDDLTTIAEIAHEVPDQMPEFLEALKKAAGIVSLASFRVDY